MNYAISIRDIEMAEKRLAGHVLKTPLRRSEIIDYMTGKTVWFKPECKQKVRAFKYRGAYNRLSALTDDEKRNGVVAFSSGNHAQGVARAARELGLSAKIVMPTDAPTVKVKGVERNGGEIIFYDRLTESREAIAQQISEDEKRIIVPSYDDPHIIAGQGTVGLEIATEAKARKLDLDAVIMPMGGGGLCAGTGMAVKSRLPDVKIFGAEPEHYNDHQRSLNAGERQTYPKAPPTLCDAVMTPIPGELTFPINLKNLSAVYTATDRDCLMAMALIKRELGLPGEPGGVLGLAAILAGQIDENVKTLCVVISGGNSDPEIQDRANALLGLV